MNDDLKYYYELELWDGEKIKVKPIASTLEHIRTKMQKGDGFIVGFNDTINVKDVKRFHQTETLYTDQKLLEGAAQAFNEPITNPDGSIQAKWVKRAVTRRRWENYYRFNNYHLLEEGDNGVIIAFRIPVHLAYSPVLEDMSENEIKAHKLENRY